MELNTIEVVRRHSLTALVRDALEREIVEGRLAPGEKLNEAYWAGRLQVSRGPVREAFRALEQIGLVRTHKNRGVFVRTVTLEEAAEIYAVRAALEEAACRMLAQRIGEAQLAALSASLERMRATLDEGDLSSYARENIAFHDAIVAHAGNAKLAETYRRLVGELNLFRRAALAVTDDAAQRSLAEHREIVAALAARDGEAAAAAMHAHVAGGLARARQTAVGRAAGRGDEYFEDEEHDAAGK
ncbi:phosphonate utilization associated transcriptional regulator [Trinickia dabaoshanensis]|uniref:Phosphonate utilization associated transcriptional regulator n=1 Tax=Trinickia dabaoshanensis TaxID=564714 RepID=A0A2N7VVH1_9BURK|nr:phosphonate utilization associated transcriptional regulator [Trinickia dabaoshanensis]PMS21147.1 phosphonate utilization associated transcriptional regulator [Trinickia dabaoshanensis]